MESYLPPLAAGSFHLLKMTEGFWVGDFSLTFWNMKNSGSKFLFSPLPWKWRILAKSKPGYKGVKQNSKMHQNAWCNIIQCHQSSYWQQPHMVWLVHFFEYVPKAQNFFPSRFLSKTARGKVKVDTHCKWKLSMDNRSAITTKHLFLLLKTYNHGFKNSNLFQKILLPT